MPLRRIAAPAVDALTLQDAKTHCRVDSADEDALIGIYLKAALGQVEGPTSWVGRALISQEWALDLDRFPCGPIEVPLPPLISVEALKYVDAAGVTQTVDEDAYIVHVGEFGLIEPAPGYSWPTPGTCRSRCVTVEFTAGYGAAASDIPGEIRAAMLLMVGDLYKNRETTVEGTTSARVQMSTTVENLLTPFRTNFL